MIPISLKATGSAFPERVVPNEYFGGDRGVPRGGMFRGARVRHHMDRAETATDLIVQATRTMQERVELDVAAEADIILTNVSIPDLPFTGCGAEVAKALGARPDWVYDVNSHGCVSFISMIALARSLMNTSSE